ncbi:hypothetical protein [Dactylosporangium sp. NPDC049140]|jgi:hypothetical protein|uniref:hypothetical protein n=1 Tax=Dactylosporangium sp. NPDC049140 TaxID=3155647 RepID=UPI0033F37621
MSIRRTRVNAATSERLLAGDSVDDQHHRLAAVLTASAGPALQAELTGLHQAVAGFRSAQLQPIPLPRRQSVVKTALLKLLTVKAVVVTTLVIGAGGVALAATTGTLPNPLSKHADPAASARSSLGPAGSSGSQHASGASPSPSLVGLCHAYTAGAGSEHGKALENPAFATLVTAAGGKDNVDEYCAKLLASASAQPSPQRNAESSEHPTGTPTDHPTGKPSAHQTGKPSERPSH